MGDGHSAARSAHRQYVADGLGHGMARGRFGCHQDRTAAWKRRIRACPTGASAANPLRVRRDAWPQRFLAYPPAPAHRIRAFAWRRNTPKRPRRAMRFATPPPRNTPLRIGAPHARARAGALDPLRGGAQPADPPAQLRSGVPLRGATGRALKRNSTVSERTPDGPAGGKERGKHDEWKRFAEQVRTQRHAEASQSG